MNYLATHLFPCLAAVMSFFFPATMNAEIRLSDADLANAYRHVDYSRRTSVHDPSVVVDTLTDPAQETFYVFGSHMGVSKSKDLIRWTSNVAGGEQSNATLYGRRNPDGSISACSYNEAFKKHEITSVNVIRENGLTTTVPFGNFDAVAWNTALSGFTVQGNQWAADVIYNPTMGKWLYYVSLNGSRWNSVVVCMAADRIEGPYVYQGPVVFSGFNVENGSPDYTASDLPIVLGETNVLPARYARGSQWGTYWPHAIDPCVFYDEEGNLWMAYGSWSGGIYVLELDENTGLRDYTVSYPAENNTSANVTSDPYFGRKIAGGHYVSGEGAYIEHIGNWYYLFLSYGFYSPEGGYEMRIFRSSNPDGPYTDCSTNAGVSAIYTSYQMNYGPKATTGRGMKLMGSYQWDTTPVAELAQGHNSAMTDREGRSFVVYHTKFNNGTAGHQVRVHQLFVNQDGWICAAPFEYSGETATQTEIATTEIFRPEEIAGTYQLLSHTYRMDYENYAYNTPVEITLHPDGTLSGAYTGSWSTTAGTSYITLRLNDIEYKGVLCRQTIDYTDIPAVCFTAVSSSSGTAGSTRALSIWGAKTEAKAAIAYTVDHLPMPASEGDKIYADLTLPAKGLLGCDITWKSNDEALLSSDGKIAPTASPIPVTLTQTIHKDGYVYQRDIHLTVSPLSGDCLAGLQAYYNFENTWRNSINPKQIGIPMAEANGTKPAFEYNAELGNRVLRQHFGYPSDKSSSYVRFPNPLQGASLTEGATISLFIQRTADNSWDAIWSFLDEDNSDGVNGRLYMTPNTYLGFNGTGGWFDVNYPTATIGELGLAEWHHLAATFDASGWKIYIDGKKKYDPAHHVSFNCSSDFSDYGSVLRLLSSAAYFYFGHGSWWGSAPVLLDELTLYSRALTDDDIMTLYVNQKNGTFSDMTAIGRIENDASGYPDASVVYDLQGRIVDRPTRGFYITGGKKIYRKPGNEIR